MSSTNITNKTDMFAITNYGKKSPFSSSLPSVAGVHGIPIWCHYVNRGQCVVSFGVENKDHAIMEFYPAHQAYQNVKTTGFRTFIHLNNNREKTRRIYEPFSQEELPHGMEIAMNGLTIWEENTAIGLKTTVQYSILPEEKVGALVRRVTIENKTNSTLEFEVLDGMPAVIPYGIRMELLKNMGQTAKAWMQVEDVETKRAFFRVRASIDDTTVVEEIAGGNFSLACLADGSLMQPIVDPEIIFGYDTSLQKAVRFSESRLEELWKANQIKANKLPCCFYGMRKSLQPGEKVELFEIFGQVADKGVMKEYSKIEKNGAYFIKKWKEAQILTEEIVSSITTQTRSKSFDAYCNHTYLDNVLRGGYPIKLGHRKIFYLYSRKHGDLERDYNYFSMLPEFYSQGNGNFRDVNQNRRCDTFFAPFVGRENIKMFYNLIQLDGYNPLSIDKMTYEISNDQVESILLAKDNEMLWNKITEEKLMELKTFLSKAFTPGALYHKLSLCAEEASVETLFVQIIDFANSMVNASFSEGYWSDHWTYNLDLILDYLEIFPEKEKELFFEEEYTCFLSQVNVNPVEKRYQLTPKGLRQYHALDESSKRDGTQKLVRTNYGSGDVLSMTLFEKLVLLSATKFATLDAFGMGIEMEGGKPGWYDALNGLPALSGSSMAESYELCRMLEYTLEMLYKYAGKISLIEELFVLLKQLHEINQNEKEQIHFCERMLDGKEVEEKGHLLTFWNQINTVKESYRNRVFEGIYGKKYEISMQELAQILEGFLETVKCGITKACLLGNEICPTYFYYEITDYEKTTQGYRPLHFTICKVPYFLEGPVRFMKLKVPKEKKRELYRQVKKSDLYDEKLKMYKVNASLKNASYELGRAKAFTPGWLENESIWMHMEYEYLLEMLKNGLYMEFFQDFQLAAVPFLDPEVYGRSIYENSSFIASSKNPDQSIHGKGFVARLSGSTIEFMSIWKYMMFGNHVMSMKNGELCFSPQPALPAYLIPEDGKVSTTLFSKTQVNYQFAQVNDYYPGNYQISGMEFIYQNGSKASVNGGCAGEKIAKDIRNGVIKEISIKI